MQQPLCPAAIYAPREDDRDLCFRPAGTADGVRHAPGYIPVRTVGHLKRDSELDACFAPAIEELLGPREIHRGVEGPDLRRVDRAGVADRLEDTSIQPVDQDENDVALPGPHGDQPLIDLVADTAVILNEGDGDGIHVPERCDQVRATFTRARASTGIGCIAPRDDDGRLDV